MQSSDAVTTATGGKPDSPSQPVTRRELSTAFGSNLVRLRLLEWGVVALVIGSILWGLPRWWKHSVPFDVPADYRVPYPLSSDYWTYARWMETASADPAAIFIVGDSVVWGEYVAPRDTLASCLNRIDKSHHFVNAGLNGTHPLALEGLVRYYAKPLHGRLVILHCNLLWMSSPERDLQVDKEVDFNHPDLIPQLRYRIPCYRANANRRLGVIIDRHFALRGLINHVRIKSFDGQDLQDWSIEHPYADPFPRIHMRVQQPSNKPHSRPIPWTQRGMGQQDLPWVKPESSYQWLALVRTVRLLRQRGDRVFVMVGPFNEHLLTVSSRSRYTALRQYVETWLAQNAIPHFVPETLPSLQYGDASHPLAVGYQQLGESLTKCAAFRRWLAATTAEKH